MSIAWYLAVSAIVFALGVVGVMTRRNPLVVLLCLELMLNGANLSLIAFSRMWGNGDGQIPGSNIAAHRWTKAYKREMTQSRVESTRALVNTLAGLKQPPHTPLVAAAGECKS